jgi:hypothetical protein
LVNKGEIVVAQLIAAEGEAVYELPWTPLQYGIAAMAIFTLIAWAVTRMNRDR